MEKTPALAWGMMAGGLKALVTCVDPSQLGEAFLGRGYDERFLADPARRGQSVRRAGRVPHLLLLVP